MFPKFSIKPNVKSTWKFFDSEVERVTIGVLTSHVSLNDVDIVQYSKAIADVQTMDIPPKKKEQFTIKM
jgi:hypothetical protein